MDTATAAIPKKMTKTSKKAQKNANGCTGLYPTEHSLND